jgi:Ca2+-transporting ATPase
MLAEGSVLAAGVLSAYLWVIWQGGAGPRATTMAFMGLVLIHPFQAINCRSEQLHWWRLPSNGLTWAALATLIGLQWLSISLDPLTRLLGTVPLAMADWIALGTAVLWPVVVLEVVKTWGMANVGRPRPIEAAGGSTPTREIGRNH